MDNRIILSSTLVEQDTATGQDHDSYPSPGQQARYDWLRSYLIGLLSSQSSADAPSQYREGTVWFDLTAMAFKAYRNGSWVHITDAISANRQNAAEDSQSLSDWIDDVSDRLHSVKAEILFSGTCSNSDVTQIPIPESIRTTTAGVSVIDSSSRAIVWVNGVQLNPNHCTIQGSGTQVVVTSDDALQSGDRFTVSIRSIPSRYYYTNTVQV